LLQAKFNKDMFVLIKTEGDNDLKTLMECKAEPVINMLKSKHASLTINFPNKSLLGSISSGKSILDIPFTSHQSSVIDSILNGLAQKNELVFSNQLINTIVEHNNAITNNNLQSKIDGVFVCGNYVVSTNAYHVMVSKFAVNPLSVDLFLTKIFIQALMAAFDITKKKKSSVVVGINDEWATICIDSITVGCRLKTLVIDQKTLDLINKLLTLTDELYDPCLTVNSIVLNNEFDSKLLISLGIENVKIESVGEDLSITSAKCSTKFNTLLKQVLVRPKPFSIEMLSQDLAKFTEVIGDYNSCEISVNNNRLMGSFGEEPKHKFAVQIK
jgi:hypothetical protein